MPYDFVNDFNNTSSETCEQLINLLKTLGKSELKEIVELL